MIKQMILPILALLFANLKGENVWILPAGMGALFLILLFFAFLSWKNTVYYIENGVLFYQKGVLSKSKQGIPTVKITTIHENQELIERIFRLSTFKVDAGSATQGNEIKLTISKTEAKVLREMLGKVTGDLKTNEPSKTEYHVSNKELVLYAVTSNSLFAGLLFVLAAWQLIEEVPFVNRFIEESAEEWIRQYLDTTIKGLSLSVVITAVLFLILAYLMFSFLVSILFTLIKYYDFTVSRHDQTIEIRYGLLEKKRYNLQADKITALYLKYGLIGQFFKISAVKIESIGYGDEKGETALLYPLLRDEKRAEILGALLPEYLLSDIKYKPPQRALKSFLLIYTTAPFIIALALSLFVPYGAFSWIAVPLFCMSGFANYKKTGISRISDQFTLTGGVLGKWTATVQSRHIQSITTKQSFLQKRNGLIHLEYSYQSNHFGKHLEVKFLDQNETGSMTEF
jgi:putative membrane protein